MAYQVNAHFKVVHTSSDNFSRTSINSMKLHNNGMSVSIQLHKNVISSLIMSYVGDNHV